MLAPAIYPLLLIAIALLIPSRALAQFQHGTIVVVYYAKNKIIFAADSSVVNFENMPNKNLPDVDCKIATPDAKIIFASAGAMGFQSPSPLEPVQSYTNVEEFRKAYEQAPATNRVFAAATLWQNSIISHLEAALFYHPDAPLPTTQLPDALIAGLADDGSLLLLSSNIEFNGLTYSAAPPTRVTCPDSYCAIGETKIVDEFTAPIAERSERAKKEARDWRPPKRSKPADYDIRKTMRLVELTIMYPPIPGTVGPPIDAVQLDKSGKVHWFSNKKGCPIN